MKTAIYAFTYKKEAALMQAFIQRLRAARGSLDAYLVVVNDARNPLPQNVVNALNGLPRVQVVDTSVPRFGDLRSFTWFKEQMRVMEETIPDADAVIKIDVDTIPVNMENVAAPLLDPVDPVDANFALAEEKFRYGFCYALTRACVSEIRALLAPADSKSMDLLLNYLALTFNDRHFKTIIPLREDAFLYVTMKMLRKKFADGVAYRVFDEGPHRMAGLAKDMDVMLVRAHRRANNRSRLEALAQGLLAAKDVVEPVLPDGEMPKVALVTGTGQCGTDYMANLLNHQPGTSVRHEIAGPVDLNLEVNPAMYLRKIKRANKEGAVLVGDSSLCHKDRVRELLAHASANGMSLKIVGLLRDPVATKEALLRQLDKAGADHFTPAPGDADREYTVWSKAYPKYETGTLEERVAQYVAETHALQAALESEFPDSLKNVQLTDMNDPVKVEALFDWVGVPADDRRLEAVGIPTNSTL